MEKRRICPCTWIVVRKDLNKIRLVFNLTSSFVLVFTFKTEMFPTVLLQLGGGIGEEDTQQGGALLTGQFSSTSISSFFLRQVNRSLCVDLLHRILKQLHRWDYPRPGVRRGVDQIGLILRDKLGVIINFRWTL